MVSKTRKEINENKNSDKTEGESNTIYSADMLNRSTEAEYKAELLNLEYQQTVLLAAILEKLSEKDN